MIAVLEPQDIEPPVHGHWLEPLHSWPAAAIRSVQNEGAVVRVVIASVRGSSPREVGTCMLVEQDRIFGTIGGGQLEWSAIATARTLLANFASPSVILQKLVLGPQLSQCCGGAVELWLERYTAADLPSLQAALQASNTAASLLTMVTGERIERRILRHPTLDKRAELRRDGDSFTLQERLDEALPNVWLYGAGHVGQALARILATLPLRLTWIDSRAELLPAELGDAVCILPAVDPLATLAAAPRGTRFVIMTHSHPLDYALCRAALERDDRPWVGVIGSNSKSVRFRSHLIRDGLAAERAGELVCPLGVEGIDSKLPAVIAVSVATQLLQSFATPVRLKDQGHDCATGGCSNCALHAGTKP